MVGPLCSWIAEQRWSREWTSREWVELGLGGAGTGRSWDWAELGLGRAGEWVQRPPAGFH